MEGGSTHGTALWRKGVRKRLAYFPQTARAEEMISLSFALEDGNRVFYDRISREVKEEKPPRSSDCWVSRRAAQGYPRELHARISEGRGPAHRKRWRRKISGGGLRSKRRLSGPRERRWRRFSSSPSRWRRTPWTATSRWGVGRGRPVQRSLPALSGKNRCTWSG